SSEIIVMYLGKIVEKGPAEQVFLNPAHPYTIALFEAIPDINTDGVEGIKTIEGQVPSAINPPSGCRFHTRCTKVFDRCRTEEPSLQDVGNGQCAACHLLASSKTVNGI
ncbi:MAG TPA: peptide ABC transporter substrate-binding protein, partial [Bacillota bacterium]|nr:peptide ABC transporter substrate-binding protein [Bacillota bacterium]